MRLAEGTTDAAVPFASATGSVLSPKISLMRRGMGFSRDFQRSCCEGSLASSHDSVKTHPLSKCELQEPKMTKFF